MSKKKVAKKKKTTRKKATASTRGGSSKKKSRLRSKAAKKKASVRSKTKNTKVKAATRRAKKPAGRKTATKVKKTAAKKKVAKKKVTKKKVSAKKKAASSRKTAAKKKVAKKKVAKKKVTKKKVSAKAKATSSRKTAAKKKVAKKKVSTKAKSTSSRKKPVTKKASSAKKRAPKTRATAEKSQVTTPAASPAKEVKEVVRMKKEGVIRVAQGERRPFKRSEPERAASPAANGVNTTSESAESNPPKKMSVAAKKRAEAEAAFRAVAPSAQANEEPQVHRSEFELRVSARDSLTSELRHADSKAGALSAARTLAEKFELPPDQGLLLKIISLKDKNLSRLALEELIELEDRGRVRANDDLVGSLRDIRSRDKETVELRDLLLRKIGRPMVNSRF